MSNRTWGGVVSCAWLLVVGACGQELVLPTAQSNAVNAGAPDEGFTGPQLDDGGAPTLGRLPIADRPSFSSFGGEGGVSSVAGDQGGAGAGNSLGEERNFSGGVSGLPDRADAGAGSIPIIVIGSSGGDAGGAGGADSEGGAAGSAAPPSPPRLWFSEYVEGSGSYKALEIYAPQPASLEGCDLETYFNGKTEPSRLALHGALEGGAVQVLCSTALAAQLSSQCDRSTSLTFNGDDALALRCSGTLLDVIGEIGVDPGTAWASGATLDHTLSRRCSVTSGNPTPTPGFEPDAEWETFGVDTWSDLGKHDCKL